MSSQRNGQALRRHLVVGALIAEANAFYTASEFILKCYALRQLSRFSRGNDKAAREIAWCNYTVAEDHLIARGRRP